MGGSPTSGARASPEQHTLSRVHTRPKPLSTMLSHLIAALAEYVGTFMFLYLGYAGHLMAVSAAASPLPSPPLSGGLSSSTVIFISLSYGMSLLVNVWAFYRISGGLLNPAVTLALALTGHLDPMRAVLLVPAQLLASMTAGGLVRAMFPGDLSAVNTTLSGGTTVAQGVFIEMFLTAQLVFVVLMLAQEKSRDTFIAPMGIGLALFTAEIPGVYYTGGSLNPARSFGVAVASASFPGYHWIYWLGPVLGACLSTSYYHFVKYFRYEEVNPGQDSIGEAAA